MKKSLIYVMAIAATLFMSCKGNKSDEAVQVAADSSSVAEQLEQHEVEEMQSVIDVVSNSLDSISAQEHMIFSAKEGQTDKQKVVAQLAAFKDLIARKEAQISALMKDKKVNASDKQTIKRLQRILAYLTDELEAKEQKMTKLYELCQRKDASIDALMYDNAELSEQSTYLKDQNYQQDRQINAVYYIVASKKDLKAQGLLKTGLFSKKVNSENIDASKFKKGDKRSLKKIQINSKSPKVLTNNPASSYTITKNSDGTSTLEITDPEKFWNVSAYLIIQE